MGQHGENLREAMVRRAHGEKDAADREKEWRVGRIGELRELESRENWRVQKIRELTNLES